MNSFLTVFVFIAIQVCIYGQTPTLRSVAVKGNLVCGSVPAEGAQVRLYRINSKEASEILDSRTVGPSGLFEVNANTNGRPVNQTELLPIIKIFHKCGDDAKKTGFRRFQLGIPREFVGLGRVARNTYDVGKLNLEIAYPGETREKEVN